MSSQSPPTRHLILTTTLIAGIIAAFLGTMVAPVNAQTAPVLTTSDSATYPLDGTPVVISPTLSVTGSSTIDGAIAFISANFSTGDKLGIEGQSGTSGLISGLSWSYNGTAGVLTLSGTAGLDIYQSVLRQIIFSTTGDRTHSRTVKFSLGSSLPNPVNGHYYEFVPNSTIDWTAAKPAAAARSFFGLQGYLATVTSQSENDFITSKLIGEGWFGASDAVSQGTTEGHWIWATGPEANTEFFNDITGNPVNNAFINWETDEPNNSSSGEHFAHFRPDGKWNDYPDTLNVNGYVVEYGDMLGDPALQVSDDVTVTLVSPILSTADAAAYPQRGSPVTVSPTLSVTGSGTIDGAMAFISANFDTGDSLGIEGQSGTSGTISGLSWSYNPDAGVLTLSGTANLSTYQSVLRQITFSSTASSTLARTVKFSLGGSLPNPANGHYYEEVVLAEGQHISWTDAKSAAAARRFFGLQGYLTTITSQGESDFVIGKLTGQGWFGASDAVAQGTTEGHWIWATGPEAGTEFFDDTINSPVGSPVEGRYNNWKYPPEPNNAGGNENFGQFYGDGEWNDLDDANLTVDSYIVEYGGMPDDPTLQVNDDATVNITLPDLAITQIYTVTNLKDLSLTITARNTGPFTVTGAIVDVTFPTAFLGTNWSWTCAGTGGAECGAASGTGDINQTLGALPADGTVVFTVAGTLENWSHWSSAATITVPEGFVDGSAADNSSVVGRFQKLLPLVYTDS